jgi:hypothetical protein
VYINRNDTRRQNLKELQSGFGLKLNTLPKDVKVRWNSTDDMINAVIANEMVNVHSAKC